MPHSRRSQNRKQSQSPRRPAKADNQEQSRLFIEKARAIGADEEHSAADELLGRLAKKKPEPHAKGSSDS